MAKKKNKVRRVSHYNSSQKIFLVGEGDFSFSACLARHFGSAKNMVATSLDSKGRLKEKYNNSENHLKELKRLECLVLHKVDVNKMNKHPILKTKTFDRIVFNFPHAGHFKLNETDPSLIKMHRELLLGFFNTASKMLNENGEIHVAHRDDHPYNNWDIEELAKEAGLDLKEKVEFRQDDYPGYHQKRGGDIRSNGQFPLKDCFTFKFTVASEVGLTYGSNTIGMKNMLCSFCALRTEWRKRIHVADPK